jgi:hypothetical protein
MEMKDLKSRFGRWLTIDELRGLLAETPEEVFDRLPINRKLLETASEFVENQRGWWEHPDWEGFLQTLTGDGFQVSKDLEPPIGNILEIFKQYYHQDRFQAIIEKRRRPAAQKVSRSAAAPRPTGKKQAAKQA